MNELKIFTEQEVFGKQFCIYGTPEDPLFLAKDVAGWIEHSDVSTMLKMVDDEEKVTNIVCTLGGNQKSWFLTEDGLYEVLMQSRKPMAKQFKKKVKEILKSIRKTGGYIQGQETLSEEELMARALEVARKTLERREQRLKDLEQTVSIQTQRIAELQPKADYTDTILQSKSLMTITQIAKDYGMSGKQMNKILNQLGVQYKQSGQWLLYSKYQDKGYTSSETISFTQTDGRLVTKLDTKWTQKGRLFLYNLLKQNEILPTIEQYGAF